MHLVAQPLSPHVVYCSILFVAAAKMVERQATNVATSGDRMYLPGWFIADATKVHLSICAGVQVELFARFSVTDAAPRFQ